MERNIILDFVNAINGHNLETISSMLSDGHTFTDAHNNSITGKENMKSAWKTYFEWFPDYTIEISEIVQAETCYAVFGFAHGTYRNLHNEQKSNHFHLPAAWRAVTANEKIELWQVYCDTKVPFDIMHENIQPRI